MHATDDVPSSEYPGAPRWVKGFAWAAGVALLLFIVLHLLGLTPRHGGPHTPAVHHQGHS